MDEMKNKTNEVAKQWFLICLEHLKNKKNIKMRKDEKSNNQNQ